MPEPLPCNSDGIKTERLHMGVRQVAKHLREADYFRTMLMAELGNAEGHDDLKDAMHKHFLAHLEVSRAYRPYDTEETSS